MIVLLFLSGHIYTDFIGLHGPGISWPKQMQWSMSSQWEVKYGVFYGYWKVSGLWSHGTRQEQYPLNVEKVAGLSFA